MVGNKRRGQQLRWSRSRARVARAKSEQDARNYFAIQAMVPAWVPRQNKFDVVNSVAEDFWGGRIDRDGKARLSNIMGIHKALRVIFHEPQRGYAWIKAANTAFANRSALEVMLGGELTDLMRVRRYLDAERGAW